MPGWDENSPRLRANLTRVLGSVRDEARRRVRPTLSVVCAWHQEMMRGLDVDHPDYVGHFRGEAANAVLRHCHVKVGPLPGVPPDSVEHELRAFEERLQAAVAYLDDQIATGEVPNEETLNAVLRLCGWVHAEWVRIHPFANGNGRTARLWANFIAMRYRLAPFVRLRPRPARAAYAAAARAAMLGDPAPTARLFKALFFQHMKAWSKEAD